MKNNQGLVRRRGRPPAFDRREVLERAAKIFWRRGYEGASIVDLTDAMGITAQSLYAAFGSKAQLYREALDWYRAALGAITPEALDAPDAIAVLSALLRDQARAFTDPAYPPGCMIATAALGCAEENDPVSAMVADLRHASVALVRARLERAIVEGDLRPDADPVALARFVGAVIQGLSVQARDGAGADELVAVAELAAMELARHRA
ncbi:AcrR family transcriptional regulator [Methylopila capsulata]|uniref:AcrR family transcriptional regulator n=1 Tax=Methylopila capsulata TaxID=61654 RepID=A0ABS2TAA7_9HYPH|nr:TetR/AcrR family transcriptional regulator [Methylopila capsulata]MBM7853138.1 AcrR family transcriptional regulator [Methylopila capsulata]